MCIRDSRYTNSPLNFIVAMSRHARELRSMEDASSKTDKFEAEVMELMPSGECLWCTRGGTRSSSSSGTQRWWPSGS